MEPWDTLIKTIVEGLGFRDYRLDVDDAHRHAVLFIHEDQGLVKDHLPVLVESLNHLLQLIARKHDVQPVFLDINNYRREREQLIVELARATARKVAATGQELPLPVMNSYERRLAHVELAMHPDVTTESMGRGHGRYVVVKPISDGAVARAQTQPVEEGADKLRYGSSEIA